MFNNYAPQKKSLLYPVEGIKCTSRKQKYILIPPHHEMLHKLPTSFAHTINMYTILLLFLESMLLLIETTVGVLNGRNRVRLLDLLIHLICRRVPFQMNRVTDIETHILNQHSSFSESSG